MREILRRSITGVIYVVLLLGAVFLSSDAFDFLFMAFGLACLYEYKRIVRLKGYYMFAAYLALWWVFIYLTNDSTAVNLLMLCTIAVDLALLMFLFSKNRENSITFKNLPSAFFTSGADVFF